MGVHESKIRLALDELGCDQSAFAIISGVSQTRLSQAFRGTRDFDGPEIERLSAIVSSLRQITRDAFPIPVSFHDPAAIKRLLAHRMAGIKWTTTLQIEEERLVTQ
jgi:hypothetical protein